MALQPSACSLQQAVALAEVAFWCLFTSSSLVRNHQALSEKLSHALATASRSSYRIRQRFKWWKLTQSMGIMSWRDLDAHN